MQEYNKDVYWLDGYLKGLIDSKSYLKEQFATGAQITYLSGSSISKSFLTFMNSVLDADEKDLELKFSRIDLDAEIIIKDWITPISDEIQQLFPEQADKNLSEIVSGYVLDMIDAILGELHNPNVYCADARINPVHKGKYFFFELENNLFLVISFMQKIRDVYSISIPS